MVPIPVQRISALSTALTDILLELRDSQPPEATDGELVVVLAILLTALMDQFEEPTIPTVVKALIDTTSEDDRTDLIADLLALCEGAPRKRLH